MNISLKISILDLNTTKTLQFFSDKSIAEVTREIQEKLGEQVGSSDHGLFWPAQHKWLLKNRTLESYDIKTNDLIEYKKKHRNLKIKLMDGSVKTVLIDESLVVSLLVDSICKRIGITNPEEYSIWSQKMSSASSASSKDKDKKAAESQDGKWLNPEKGITEQGLTDTDDLILKKKFFYSDQNIDRNDPIQLNLLYVQARDGIINGTHVCSPEEACQFGALQCQAQFGNHEPDKHKPGFLTLKDFLPPEYSKKKEMEKKIYQEHRKLQGMTELNAKFRYVQLCRSLKTYGMSLFLVKEKLLNKAKFVPVLLGVTKESVNRLDPETKEILKVWPLKTLRRWAAAPTNFTLDFGDYADAFYMVETTEGETISQLIAGYIDMILKKRNNVDKNDDGEEVAIAEEYIEPAQAASVMTTSGKSRKAQEVGIAQVGIVEDDGPSNLQFSTTNPRHHLSFISVSKTGSSGGPIQFQHANVSSGETQVALVQNLQTSLKHISNAVTALELQTLLAGAEPSTILWKKQQLETSEKKLLSELAAHLAATCSIINQTSMDVSQMNYPAFSASISTISMNLNEIIPTLKLVASLQASQDDCDQLVDYAKKIVSATAKLIISAQPCVNGQGSRQELLSASKAIGASTNDVLDALKIVAVSATFRETLNKLSDALVQSMTELSNTAKPIAQKMPDHKNQQELLSLLKLLAMTATQISAEIAIISPLSNSILCREQIDECAVLVKDVVIGVTKKVDLGSDAIASKNVQNLASDVESALSELLKFLKTAVKEERAESDLEVINAKIIKECNDMRNVIGDVAKVIQSTKTIGTLTMDLVNLMKAQALTVDDQGMKNRLVVGSKNLTDSLSEFISNSKEYAKSPNSKERLDNLYHTLNEHQRKAAQVVGFAQKKNAYDDLIQTADTLLTSLFQLESSANSVANFNSNQLSQRQVMQANKKLNDVEKEMIGVIKIYKQDPENPISQTQLLSAANLLYQAALPFLQSIQAANPFIVDFAAQSQLSTFTSVAEDDLKDLELAIKDIEKVTDELELDNAIENLGSMLNTLNTVIGQGHDKSFPMKKFENFQECLSSIQKNSGLIRMCIPTVSSSSTYRIEKNVHIAAKNISFAMERLSEGLRYANNHIGYNGDLLNSTTNLISTVKQLLVDCKLFLDGKTNDPSFIKPTDSLQALTQTLDYIPGYMSLNTLANEINILYTKSVDFILSPQLSNEDTQTVSYSLNNSAFKFQQALQAFSTSFQSAEKLEEASQHLKEYFGILINDSERFAAANGTKPDNKLIAQNVYDVACSTLKLIDGCKLAAFSPEDRNLRVEILSKSVVESLGKFLDVVLVDPGQRECQKAYRIISELLNNGNNINDPPKKYIEYYKSLKDVVDCQLVVNREADVLANETGVEKIGNSILTQAEALKDFSLAANNIIYLIGAGDKDSVAATNSAFDIIEIADSCKNIEMQLINLQSNAYSKKDAVKIFQSIAVQGTNLCKAAKDVAQNPATSSSSSVQLQYCAKTIASGIAEIVNYIKATQGDQVQLPQEITQPLIASTTMLLETTLIPEFKAKEAVISPATSAIQKQLIDQKQAILNNACELCYMVDCGQCAKNLSSKLQEFIKLSKDLAPGQKEATSAIDKVTTATVEIESASIQANVGALISQSQNSEEVHKDQLLGSIRLLQSLIDVIADSSLNNVAEFANLMNQFALNYPNYVSNAISLAAKNGLKSFQLEVIKGTKENNSNWSTFLFACRKAGENGMSSLQEVQEQINTIKGLLVKGIKKQLVFLEGGEQVVAEDFVQAVTAIQGVMDPQFVAMSIQSVEKEDISSILNTINAKSSFIMEFMKPIISKSNVTGAELTQYSNQLSEECVELSRLLSQLAAKDQKNESKGVLKSSMVEFAANSIKFLESMKSISVNSNEFMNKQKLSAASFAVSESLSKISTTIQQNHQSELKLELAIKLLEDAVVDIGTTVIFAEAGQLDAVGSNTGFTKHREALVLLAKNLVEAVSGIISGATESKPAFDEKSYAAAKTLVQLKDEVRKAAAAITSNDKDNQLSLLKSAETEAQGFLNLINAGKRYLAQEINETDLKQIAKQLISQTTDVIKVIKTIGDESSRAIRILDNTSSELEEYIRDLYSESLPQGSALPEDIAGLAKQITSNVANLVSSSISRKQDDIISSVRIICQLCQDLLRSTKCLTTNAPDDKRKELFDVVTNCVYSLLGLFQTIKTMQAGTGENQDKLNMQAAAKNVTVHIKQVIDSTHAMASFGYEDQNDPNVIAERELMAAANAIEVAAKKLATMKPIEKPKQANQELNFEESILEAAKAIANATSALVKSATMTQREIIANGKLSQNDNQYFSDGTWSEGLVSAAKQVAAYTHDLCESANGVVKGTTQRERAIVSARGVASATVQLLTAAYVKVDIYSPSLAKLKIAGNAVTNATEELAKTVAIFDKQEEEDYQFNGKGAAGLKIQEMEAQMNVLALEKQIESARQRLAGIRKGKYRQ